MESKKNREVIDLDLTLEELLGTEENTIEDMLSIIEGMYEEGDER